MKTKLKKMMEDEKVEINPKIITEPKWSLTISTKSYRKSIFGKKKLKEKC